MPRKDIDYSKTIIYKIVCNDLTVQDCYVGHTTDFTKRKSQHRYNAIHSENFKVYKTIRDNGGWDNWSMIEIEKYQCNDSNEARARERYWFENLNANLNNQFPSRTRKEYKEMNRDNIKLKTQEYKAKNRDVIRKKSLAYYHENADEIKQKSKAYQKANNERLKEYRKEYNKKNREEITRKQKERRATARLLKES